MAYKVLIPQGVDASGIDVLKKLGYEIRMGSGITAEILKKEIADCDTLYLKTALITRDVLQQQRD